MSWKTNCYTNIKGEGRLACRPLRLARCEPQAPPRLRRRRRPPRALEGRPGRGHVERRSHTPANRLGGLGGPGNSRGREILARGRVQWPRRGRTGTIVVSLVIYRAPMTRNRTPRQHDAPVPFTGNVLYGHKSGCSRDFFTSLSTWPKNHNREDEGHTCSVIEVDFLPFYWE